MTQTIHDEVVRRYKIINLEFVNTLPGGTGSSFDRAIVVDTTKTEPHPITGETQPVVVFRGNLGAAHRFLRARVENP